MSTFFDLEKLISIPPVVLAILAIIAFLALDRLRIFFRRSRPSPAHIPAAEDERRKGLLETVFLPLPFATLVLVIGFLIALYSISSDVDLWKVFTSNQLVASILLAIFGFVLIERLREFSERARSNDARIDKFHERLQGFEESITSNIGKDFQKKIDQGLRRFEEFATDNSWIRKIIDDKIDSGFSTLRALVLTTLERLADRDTTTAYQLMRRAAVIDRAKGAEHPLHASVDDIEFAGFIAFQVMGDAELALEIYRLYSQKFRLNPYFCAGIVRYALLGNEPNTAQQWIDDVAMSGAIVSMADRTPQFVRRLFTRRMEKSIRKRRAFVDHWITNVVFAVETILENRDDDAAAIIRNLSNLDLSARDSIRLSHALSDLELLRGRPEVAAATLLHRSDMHSPAITEYLAYINAALQGAVLVDSEKLKSTLNGTKPRSPAERDLIKIALTLLES